MAEVIRRRRRSHYQTQITARVATETKAEVEALADRLAVDVAEVVRRALEAGLPSLMVAEIDTEEARVWWDGLTSQERSKWGKRLRHIGGAAFKAEAYRRAMAEA